MGKVVKYKFNVQAIYIRTLVSLLQSKTWLRSESTLNVLCLFQFCNSVLSDLNLQWKHSDLLC